MARHHKAFHVWMLLTAAVYWWVMDVWISRWWILLVSDIIGRERFASLEQQLLLHIQITSRSWTLIDAFTTFWHLIFFCFAMIPLYCFWAFCYRRRDSYSEALGGSTVDV
jgi:hypothetical protein